MPPPQIRPFGAQRLRFLIVEDDETDAALVVTQLRRAGFEFDATRVDNETDFVAALEGGADLILADYSMPGFGGLRALKVVKERRKQIPFIVVSGAIGDERAAECIREGAIDYVLKDRMGRLAAAVAAALESQRLRAREAAALNELRHAHAILQESERRYRLLFESNPRPMWVYDTETLQFLAVNDAAIAHYGYARNEFLAMTVLDIRQPEEPPRAASLLASSIEAPATCRHRKKDGSIIEVEIASHLIPFDGHHAKIVAINDVTVQKALQAQLLRAQRFESVGRLASGIAHDMNNILAPVMMAAPMLRLSLAPPELDKIVSTIELSARRGAELVRQLLIFGRGLDVGARAVDLAQVVRDLTRMIGETFPKNIAITTQLADELWRVRGEATQLHQVLLNLCVNARDAMPRGGSLTITAENVTLGEASALRFRGATPGPYVWLRVMDTGEGIPPEIGDKIFDPFFTTKRVGEGTGLGLATVLGIVKNHGGFLTFDSCVGRGTTFEILFRVQLEGAEKVEEPEPPLAPPGNQETILVVDDEENIRDVLRDALTRNNYRVLLAADGAEAAAVFAQRLSEIRLVISDVDMPYIDGITLTKVLRNLNPEIRVLLSTGTLNAPSTAQLSEATARGKTSVLAKPYTAARVLAAVHAALHA